MDNAIEFLTTAAKYSRKKVFLSYAKYGRNKVEFRVSTGEHIIRNSGYVLYESEKGLIKKNVKQFNYFRLWTQQKTQ
jgi:hypothetical protein